MPTEITSLPDEVITIILGYSEITIEDVINFRCVCKRFQYAAKYDKFFEKKLFERWPSAKKFYDKYKENKQKESEGNVLEKEENINFIQTGINCMTELKNYLSQILFDQYCASIIDNSDIYMIYKTIKNENLFYYEKPINIFEKNCEPKMWIKNLFIADEIKSLFIQHSRKSSCDIIERYCDIKISHYTKLFSVGSQLNILLNSPKKRDQLLEKTFTFLAQYFQPRKDVCYLNVKTSLDKIALGVLNCLKRIHPNHSIFSTSTATFTYWKNNNIDDNHWDEAEGIQIMDTLQEYIFGKLNFRSCKWNDSKLEYMCIDNVLQHKFGQQAIVLIIYRSVARRLGLRCDILLDYRIYCIYWKPKYSVTNNLKNERCFSIAKTTLKKYPNCLVNKLLFRSSLPSLFINLTLNLTYLRAELSRMIYDRLQSNIDKRWSHFITYSGLIQMTYSMARYRNVMYRILIPIITY